MELMIKKNDLLDKINKLKDSKNRKTAEEELPVKQFKNEANEKQADSQKGFLISEKTEQ